MTIHTPPKPAPKVSGLFPAWIAQELVLAAACRDHLEIDRITDRLVALGLVRPRLESGVFATRVGAAPTC